MEKLHKAVLLALLLALVAGLFGGCSASVPDEPPIALVIIIGKHANQNEFTDKTLAKIEPLIMRAVYDGEISVVLADGDARYSEILNADGTPVDFKRDAMSNVVKERRVAEYSQAVLDFLQSDATRAANSEVNLLAAIKEAELVLRDCAIGEKHIVIMDTGISTAGRVDMRSFRLDALDIPEFTSKLKELDGVLPDLTDINICFAGLGDVAAPQSLPDTTLPKLKTLWEEIFLACGVARDMISFPVSPSGTNPNLYSEDKGGFPYVTVIDFSHIEIKSKEVESATDTEAVTGGELALPDVGFHPDSAEIIDEERAKVLLQPYADAMVKHFESDAGALLYLIGTTATTVPGGDGDIVLSQSRADKLKNVLAGLGVPEDSLVATGFGAKVPAHLRTDEFRDGQFDSGLAQKNRKATVYEQKNPEFLEIMAFNGIEIGQPETSVLSD